LARKAKKAAEQATSKSANLNNTSSASTTNTSSSNNANNLSKKPVDEDPEGLKLIDHKTRDLVADAIKFLEPLQEFSPERMEGWVYGIELYLMKGNGKTRLI
jgi:hypothetical protein